MPPFGSHEARVAARPLLSPAEFAEKMAHDMPCIFAQEPSFGDPGRWYEDVNDNIRNILDNYDDDTIKVVAQSIADTINSCIGAVIRTICREFENEDCYDVLHLRLQRLRMGTRSMCEPIHIHRIFTIGWHDCGQGFHRELFRDPPMRILNEVVRECKIRLVPFIQYKIESEFAQHRDIEATSFALQELATRFDTVGIFPDEYPASEPHTMGLAAARRSACRLLPQMEKAYEAIAATITMSLHSRSDHTSILHRVLAHKDFRTITPLMGSRFEAMQFCHALAYAHVVFPPALLDNCPDFYKR